MKKLLFVTFAGLTLTSCGTINETMWALQNNREAVDRSTMTVDENRRAIEEANRGIEENRRKLEAINRTLQKAAEESK